ncbi:MAG: NAD-dependent deacylase [Anaerolineae bacterium]|nr:NAD-dependent deacylase [Anaerolineae bacterium]
MRTSNAIPESLLTSLRDAHHIAVLTGAGVSAESGVPTFRDAQSGLWANYDPEELATLDAFQRNPRLVWEWYAYRRELIGEKSPNPAHYALAALEKLVPKVTLITQNIDELHQRAGSHDAVELHGSIARCRCVACEAVTRQWDESGELPPRCAECGAMLRPDVVWFGEALPFDAFARAVAATQDADVFFSIGTSTVVYPAAALPLEAVEHGATAIEVNPESTSVTVMMDYVFQGPAGVVLPRLIAAAWPEASLDRGEDGEH